MVTTYVDCPACGEEIEFDVTLVGVTPFGPDEPYGEPEFEVEHIQFCTCVLSPETQANLEEQACEQADFSYGPGVD